MGVQPSSNNIEHLQSLKARAGRDVSRAVEAASRKTGVDFAYLMEQAAAESNFDVDAKAKTSSAKGLYQFIDKTWLDTLRNHGDKYGLSKQAEMISGDGGVHNEKALQDILALRSNPQIASLMAAELAAENKDYLQEKTGANISSTSLYLAHFLGAGQASEFLNKMEFSPHEKAASIFPKAAKANQAVFYENGRARSLEEVYQFFDQKFISENVADLNLHPAKNHITPKEAIQANVTRSLRGFTPQVEFKADVNRARSLGAMVEASHVKRPEFVQSANHRSFEHVRTADDRPLFEKLQNRAPSRSKLSPVIVQSMAREAMPDQQNGLSAAVRPHPLHAMQVGSADFTKLFSSKSE